MASGGIDAPDNNVNCKMIKWISAFLENRKMKVNVKAEFSDWYYCDKWSFSRVGFRTSAVFNLHI